MILFLTGILSFTMIYSNLNTTFSLPTFESFNSFNSFSPYEKQNEIEIDQYVPLYVVRPTQEPATLEALESDNHLERWGAHYVSFRSALISAHTTVKEMVKKFFRVSRRAVSSVAEKLYVSVNAAFSSLKRTLIYTIGVSFDWVLDLVKTLVIKVIDAFIDKGQTIIENIIPYGKFVTYIIGGALVAISLFLPPDVGSLARIIIAIMGALTIYENNAYMTLVGGIAFYAFIRTRSKYTNYITTPVNVNITNPKYEPQSETEVREDARQLLTKMFCMFSLVTCSIYGLDVPTDRKSLDSMLSRHAILGRAYQTWELLIDKFAELCDESLKIVLKYVYGAEYTSMRNVSDIEKLAHDVIDLLSLDNQLALGRDPKLAEKLELMMMRHQSLMQIYSGDRVAVTRLSSLGTPLKGMYDIISRKNPKSLVMRKEPVCVALWGESGTGKSVLATILQQDLLKISGKYDPTIGVGGQIYSRCFEQEYWDGYAGQPICIIDDFGQQKDSLTSPNLEYFELIRASNIFPWQLHSAALNEKANNPYMAEFICITTNLRVDKSLEVRSLVSSDAVSRRIHLPYEVRVIPEVQYGENCPHMCKPFMLDVDKLIEYRRERNLDITDTSHWIFVSQDGEHLNYEQFIVQIGDKYKRHYESYNARQQLAQMNANTALPKGCFTVAPQWDANKRISVSLYMSLTEEQRAYVRNLGYKVACVLTSMNDTASKLTNEQLLDVISKEMELTRRSEILTDMEADSLATLPGEKRSDEVSQGLWKKVAANLKSWKDTKWQIYGKTTLEKYVGVGANGYNKLRSILSNILTSTTSLFQHLYYTRKYYVYYAAKYMAGLLLGVMGIYHIYYEIVPWIQSWFCSKGPSSILGGLMSNSACEANAALAARARDHANVHNTFQTICDECTDLQREYQRLKQAGKILVEEPVTESMLEEMRSWTNGTVNTGHSYRGGQQQSEHKEKRSMRPMYESVQQESVSKERKNKMVRFEDKPAYESVSKDKTSKQPRYENQLVSTECVDCLDKKSNRITSLFSEIATVGEPEGIISQQADELIPKVRRNMLHAVLITEEGREIPLGTIFVLKGHKALMNYHYIQKIAIEVKRSINTKARILFKQHEQTTGHYANVVDVIRSAQEVYRGEVLTEFVIITLPKSLPLGANLLSHLCTPDDLGKLDRGVRTLLPTFMREGTTYSRVVRDGCFEKIAPLELPDPSKPGVFHVYGKSVFNQMSTIQGDCGSPLLIANDMFPRKILGFHCAGAAGTGISSVICRRDVEKFCRDEPAERDPKLITLQGEEPENFPLRDGSFRLLGKIDKPIVHPIKTTLEKSVIHGIWETQVAPAILRPPLEPDGPMIRGLMKNRSPVEPLDVGTLDQAECSYRSMLSKIPTLGVEQRVLTYEEACAGIAGNEFFPPLRRNKSAGWPYMAEVGAKGKTKYLGYDEWDFSSPDSRRMRDIVHEMERVCRKGMVPEVYFVDTLKDEKRPLEKVALGKTRVFAACPMDYSILFRKYFLGFLAYMTRTRIENESAIGTNISTNDWKRIAEKMRSFGHGNVVAGDFENYDGTLNYHIFDRVVSVINWWYNDSPSNQLVRRMLWECLIKSKHILHHFVYQMSHGQPSGNPSTAVTNTMYTSLALRYLYIQERYKMDWSLPVGAPNLWADFERDVKVVAYGDDNLIAVHPRIQSWFGPRHISQAFAAIGMRYTSEDKHAQGERLRDITEVTFLKRGFSYCKVDDWWYAPLAVQSIKEMCNWVKKSPDPVSACVENCEDAIVELYQHDKFTFENMRMAIITALRAYDRRLVYFEWRQARDMIVRGEWKQLFNKERQYI